MVGIQTATGCSREGPCFTDVKKDRKDTGVENADFGGTVDLATAPHLDKSAVGQLETMVSLLDLRSSKTLILQLK